MLSFQAASNLYFIETQAAKENLRRNCWEHRVVGVDSHGNEEGYNWPECSTGEASF
jgi:hypothetical protein